MSNRRDYTGINTVSKKRTLPNGAVETVFTFYRRACGTRLGTSLEGMTKADAIEVVRQWEAEAQQSGPTTGTVNHLFALYRKSPHFAHLAEKTRQEYRLEMARLEDQVGGKMVNSLTKTHIIAVRDARRDKPFAANATVRTFSAILTWGMKELTFVEQNPAREVAHLPTQPRDAVWTKEHRDAFMEVAGPHLRRALATLLYTVQRTGDALGLRRGAIQEKNGRAWISLRQSKTGALVALPLHSNLMKVYAENPVKGDYLCPSPDGGLWNYDSFAGAWDRSVSRANFRIARRLLKADPLPPRRRVAARAEAKMEVRRRLIVGLQRRDLRRTGMVELALCGVPDTQIAALSGHSIDTTKRILDTYIPRRPELALAAVEMWEASGEKVIALNTIPAQRSLGGAIERVMNGSANPTANQPESANRRKSVRS